MEIRKLHTPEELRQVDEINAMSFFYNLTDEHCTKPEAGKSVWGAIEDGRVLSLVHVPEYEMMYHGRYVPMFGIGGVSTRAECRNRGFIRKLFQAIFAEMDDKGFVCSYLYPFSFPYYEKFGYGLGVTRTHLKAESALFCGFRSAANACLYRQGDDLTPYRAVFDRFAQRYTGAVRRAGWEDAKQYKAFENQKYLYLFTDGRQPLAYLGYRVERQPDGKDFMMVQDCAWVDSRGLSEIWGFIAGMRSHLSRVDMFLPADVPVDRMVGDVYGLERRLAPAGQVRITHVQKALEGYPWPTQPGSAAIAVRDDAFEKNNGVFLVRYENGAAEVTKTNSAPDLEIDIRLLSPLLFGSLAFSDLPFCNPGYYKVNHKESQLAGLFVHRPTLVTEFF